MFTVHGFPGINQFTLMDITIIIASSIKETGVTHINAWNESN